MATKKRPKPAQKPKPPKNSLPKCHPPTPARVGDPDTPGAQMVPINKLGWPWPKKWS